MVLVLSFLLVIAFTAYSWILCAKSRRTAETTVLSRADFVFSIIAGYLYCAALVSLGMMISIGFDSLIEALLTPVYLLAISMIVAIPVAVIASFAGYPLCRFMVGRSSRFVVFVVAYQLAAIVSVSLCAAVGVTVFDLQRVAMWVQEFGYPFFYVPAMAVGLVSAIFSYRRMRRKVSAGTDIRSELGG